MLAKEKDCRRQGGHFWDVLADIETLPTGEKILRPWNPKCKICGKFSLRPCKWFHTWKGCFCVKCGARRPEDGYHHWVGCTCSSCGKHRDKEHKWEGCKCSVCFKEQHKWKFNSRSESAGIGCSAFNHYVCTECGKEKAEPVR